MDQMIQSCSDRPYNILFISTDQFRYDCVGYAEEYPVKTPNLNMLCKEAVRFRHSYSPLPTCCPARQSLLCGKRAERFGALWNYDQGIPVQTVNRDTFSWAGELKKEGYMNGYIGKWHVHPELTPLDFGYDEYVSVEQLETRMMERNPGVFYKKGFEGEVSPYPLEDSPTHQTADEVIRFIKKYEGQKWHVKMDFSEPHLPCRPSEPYATMYQDSDVVKWKSFEDKLINKPYIQKQMLFNWDKEQLTWEECREMVKLYYGYITQVDDAIGKVLDFLKKSGHWKDTIIIFTSDHGDMCGDRRMMDKHYVMYDSVVRVPLIIRYPQMKSDGRVCDDLVVNMLDLVPTILEMAGCCVPEDLDGISLMPIIRKESSCKKRPYVLSTYNGQQFGLYCQRMIRNKKWKYIWNATDVDELYDMENDPYEMTNLTGDKRYSQILSELRKDMIEELDRVDDFMIKSPWLRHQLESGKKIAF